MITWTVALFIDSVAPELRLGWILVLLRSEFENLFEVVEENRTFQNYSVISFPKYSVLNRMLSNTSRREMSYGEKPVRRQSRALRRKNLGKNGYWTDLVEAP